MLRTGRRGLRRALAAQVVPTHVGSGGQCVRECVRDMADSKQSSYKELVDLPGLDAVTIARGDRMLPAAQPIGGRIPNERYSNPLQFKNIFWDPPANLVYNA